MMKTEALEKITSPEKMITLTALVERAREQGYTDKFSVTPNNLLKDGTNRYYHPGEITVDNFYRFETDNDPEKHVALYLISIPGSKKGIVIYTRGDYNNAQARTAVNKIHPAGKQAQSVKTTAKHRRRMLYIAAASLLVACIAATLKRKNSGSRRFSGR